MKTGIDIVKIERIKSLGKKKVFTKNEINYCEKFSTKQDEHFAGFYAVKEAFYKALGVGLTKLNDLLLIEVGHDDKGKPILFVENKVLKQNNLLNSIIDISISHEFEYAVAICIIK